MSLHNGRPYLAIPGPSVMPDRVLQAMHQPSPNIYYGELVDMMGDLVKDLRTEVETSDTQRVLDGDLDQFMGAALAARVGETRGSTAE